MGLPGHAGSARAQKEVKVRSGVGLLHMVNVQALPAAVRRGEPLGDARRRDASDQLILGDVQLQQTPRDVRCDRIAVLDQASGPPAAASGATWSTTVPYAVPLIRPSHTRTMSRTPNSSVFRGSGRFATSGMPGYPFGAAAPENEDRVRGDRKLRVVNPGVQVLGGVEYHRVTPLVTRTGVYLTGGRRLTRVTA